MMIQYIIIFSVIALSIAYAGYRIILAIKHSSDPCYGCSGCALKDLQRKKNRRKKSKPSCWTAK